MDIKELRKLIRETIMETFDEFNNPYHIIVLFDKADLEKIDLLTEGQWVPSDEKGYWKRLDKPKFDFEKLHIHIARDKHINNKNKQVSWNDDGTRHDKKSFNNNFVGIETAKRIARNALGLPDNFQLENISEPTTGQLLLEGVESIPSTSSIFIFEVSKSKILKG